MAEGCFFCVRYSGRPRGSKAELEGSARAVRTLQAEEVGPFCPIGHGELGRTSPIERQSLHQDTFQVEELRLMIGAPISFEGHRVAVDPFEMQGRPVRSVHQ